MANPINTRDSFAHVPQPHASTSKHNPQLGPNPYFTYPTPTAEQIEAELPPYDETENVPLGDLLERLSRKGYGDMRTLLEETYGRKRREYAKVTRQAVLKYLAVLRWKKMVDIAVPASNIAPVASFPTPQELNEPSPGDLKGKGKAVEARGKISDTKRVVQFLLHQNSQQDMAIIHLKEVVKDVDWKRERNADLLTAISLLTLGKCDPPSLIEGGYFPPEPLTPSVIAETLDALNEHLEYRVRCMDEIPPGVIVEKVENGRVHARGGGDFGWKVQLTLWSFQENSRWFLLDIEWGWASGDLGSIAEQEKQQILSTANEVVLQGDAPLVKLYNLIQHLSLACQLEKLYDEGVALSQGIWRNSMYAEMDPSRKILRIRYWIRRPPGKRPNQRVVWGGTLSISILESALEEEDEKTTPRVLRLKLTVKWEIGEAGIGGSYTNGLTMDTSLIQINPSTPSIETILNSATRIHASHLTRLATTALSSFSTGSLQETSDNSLRPLAFQIPLPSNESHLLVSVSALTGLLEIEDDGAKDSIDAGENSRWARAKLASASVNEQKAKLADAVGRLATAIVIEELENLMRQLGWIPLRRLPLRSQDLARNELHPASTIFIQLPSSDMHYFVTKLTSGGLGFELLKLSRIPNDKVAIGKMLVIGDRSPLDLAKMRSRVSRISPKSPFQADRQDLKDLYLFSNALVAQTIVEQQLKDRSIPYTEQFPSGQTLPESKSAVAGMIPTLCVNAKDLLKDGRAGDVAMPKVFMQIKDWWKGGKCQVVTVVQLRHKPSLAAGSSTSDGIAFDQNSSTVRFLATDITKCVPSFLEQWKRLSKVILVAGEITRLSKLAEFEGLKLLAFDLRTATVTYAPGHIVAVTYTPASDSYSASFSSPDSENPHERLSPLLSHHLNLIASRPNSEITKEFIKLLRDTLTILIEVQKFSKGAEGDFPALVIRSVKDYRLVWDVSGKRYALDVSLTPRGDYILRDASVKIDDFSCGPLSALAMKEIVEKVYGDIKSLKGGQGGEDNQDTVAKSGRVPIMKLDNGSSMMCERWLLGDTLRGLVGEIERSLGSI